MTRARKVQPGSTYLVTRRVAQRRFGLRPDAEAVQIYEYALAECADRFGVALNAWVMMSNHHHLAVQDLLGQLPRFNTRLHWLIARAMNGLREWRENFWSTDPVNVVRLVTPDDAFARLVYINSNPLRADLVDSPGDWAGAISFAQNVGIGPKLVARPRFFREDGTLPDRLALRATRLGGFEHLTGDQWRAKVAEAMAVAEASHRDRRRRAGVRVRGMAAVLRDSPNERPTTAPPRRQRCPELACDDRERRSLELLDLRGFQAKHREASRQLQAGDRAALFPAGTFQMQALAEPEPGERE